MEQTPNKGLSRASLKRKKKSLGGTPRSSVPFSNEDAGVLNETPGNKKNHDLEKSAHKKNRKSIDSNSSPAIIKTIKSVNADINPLNNEFDAPVLPTSKILAIDNDMDATEKGRAMLANIITPTSLNSFYKQFFDGKQPLHCDRGGNTTNVKPLMLSKKKIEKILERNVLFLGSDVETFRYDDTKQSVVDTNENKASEVEQPIEINSRDFSKYLQDGFSCKLLHPQKYDDNIWQALSLLEQEFNSPIACNLSISPSNTANFPVRYDCIDRFVLQLEGSSQWTVYQSITGGELPREGSADIGKTLVDSMKPYMDISLCPGDTLFLPRGWIFKHEITASTTSDSNDLSHPSIFLELGITHSNTTIDFIEVLIPQALAAITQSNLTLRQALPRGFLSFNGVAHSEDDEDNRRTAFRGTIKKHLNSIVEEAVEMIDAAADQLAKQFLCARQPPPLGPLEESQSYTGAPNAVIYPFTKLRMLRPGLARAMVEDGMVIVYHCMDNSREPFGAPMNPLEFELDDGPAIEVLLKAYPSGITVGDLPHPSEELDDKVDVARSLFKEGFLVIEDEASKQVRSDDEQQDGDDDDPF